MAGVRLVNVAKKYEGNDYYTIKPTTFEVRDTEFLVLVGPSGCGKTTTLRMVAGLEDITEGEIYIGDTLVNNLPPKSRDIAMVFQNYALYPHMNVYNNMAFGLKLRNVPKDEIDRRVREASRILNLENMLDRKPKQLSGGQRQRVALGRAIVRDPKVFLMDEPLSNLDAKLRVQMRAEIRKLHDRLKTTFIYVTHDQVEAMTMGDRIAIFHDGIVQQIGTPQEVYDNPANKFVAGFIGSPAMNFLRARVTASAGGKFIISGHNATFTLTLEGKRFEPLMAKADEEVILGLRPENITPASPALKDNLIPAEVEIVEQMGSEKYVHMKVGKDTVVARFSADQPVHAGERINVTTNIHKLHVFDRNTEKTIV